MFYDNYIIIYHNQVTSSYLRDFFIPKLTRITTKPSDIYPHFYNSLQAYSNGNKVMIDTFVPNKSKLQKKSSPLFLHQRGQDASENFFGTSS